MSKETKHRVVKVTLRKSAVEQGLNDIKSGNIFYAKDSADLVKQIFE